jgi:predicted HTH domain antitoxin
MLGSCRFIQVYLTAIGNHVIFKNQTYLNMMDLLVKEEILQRAEITAEELLIEIAVYLYDKERLTMGQARNLTQLDQLSFQQELAKRDVYIKYDVEDLDEDLATLRSLKNKRAS